MAQLFSTRLQAIQEKTRLYLLDLANRIPLSFVSGTGTYLFDTEGRRYLDFVCGIAVTSLGHSHPDILTVIREQSSKLIHVSNLYYNHEQAELAEMLIKRSFPGKAFFFNSGTEANEAAFKLCRRYGQEHKNGATLILSLQNSFHGRTTASICLTGQENIHSGFGPLLPGHVYLPINDLAALKQRLKADGENICGFFVELIQGESGIFPLEKEYILEVRRLCQEHGVLFVVDEIQTGLGRTGKLFCYEHYGIVPDLMTLAKALGSGIPIAALITGKDYCGYLRRGQHGTTLGGNPLAARVGLETLRIIERDELLDNVKQLSAYIFTCLQDLQKKFPVIEEIRGMGFHIGLGLKSSAADFISLCRHKGLLLNATANNAVRIMPPLTLSRSEAEAAIGIISAALVEMPLA